MHEKQKKSIKDEMASDMNDLSKKIIEGRTSPAISLSNSVESLTNSKEVVNEEKKKHKMLKRTLTNLQIRLKQINTFSDNFFAKLEDENKE